MQSETQEEWEENLHDEYVPNENLRFESPEMVHRSDAVDELNAGSALEDDEEWIFGNLPWCCRCNISIDELAKNVDMQMAHNFMLQQEALREMCGLTEQEELLLLDSGSSTHGVQESGQQQRLLRTATGEVAEQSGMRLVRYTMPDGMPGTANYEILNITRPIISAGKLKATGHVVHFGQNNEPS